MVFNDESANAESRLTLPTSFPPSGTITLVFTDIEGSSALWETYRDAFKPVLEAHDGLLRTIAHQHHGTELRHNGDGLFLSFALASDAVLFAVDAQLALTAREWTVASSVQTVSAPLVPAAPHVLDFRVRMGMHTCEAQNVFHPTGAIDYAGAEVNRAARVGSAAHGGQITASVATVAIAARQLPDDISFADLGTHRLKGVGEEHLWQVCGRDLATAFPPPATLDVPRHNLPVATTAFIGRGEVLQAAQQQLGDPATRLLTIAGFGGMGKTTFALQLAARMVDDYPDGVWWVPLENAHTSEEMIARIAEQLKLHLQPQPTVEEQLWNFYRNRQLLLVLDNLEQIEPYADAGRVIAGLLKAGPLVKCVATSRRHLRLSSERIFELEPMSLSEAETLFTERARARKAGFVLDERNIEDVRAICRTVDGLPLAVEIAASLIVLLPPRQILKRLSDRLRTLQMRAPDMPARHLALRAVSDWSYNLLTENARDLFQQISVFLGGFTVEAVEAVCESTDAIESLQELRSGSLLRQTTDSGTQQERLWMLQSVRDYALEKRLDSALHPEVTARHAQYFLEFMRERIEHLRTSHETEALYEMEREFDNLHAALDWAEVNDAVCCVESAILFSQSLFLRGRWQEAQAVQDQGRRALDIGNAVLTVHHPQLLYHAADLAFEMGRWEDAQTLAQQSLDAFRALNDVPGIANALNLLGVMAMDGGDAANAQTLLEEALRLVPSSNVAGRGKALHNLARLADQRGERAAAWQLYQDSLKLRQRAGDERGEATTLSNMGALAQLEGDYARARRFYYDSLRLRRASHETVGIAITLHNLGELCAIDGELARAVGLLVHAQRLFHELESPWEQETKQTLEGLREQLGEAHYNALHTEAETSSWESLV